MNEVKITVNTLLAFRSEQSMEDIVAMLKAGYSVVLIPDEALGPKKRVRVHPPYEHWTSLT